MTKTGRNMNKFQRNTIVLTLIAVFAILCFTQGPTLAQPIPRTVREDRGISVTPSCRWQLVGSSGNRIGSITAIGTYVDCDLMARDDLFSPKICVYIFNSANARATPLACSPYVQGRTHDVVTTMMSCRLGDKMVVHSWMIGYSRPLSQLIGTSGTAKVVCGGGTW